MRRSADRARAIGVIERLVSVGQHRQHPASAIFLDRVQIDIGPGDLDLRQVHRQRVPRGAVPFNVARLKLRQIELVADIAR